MDRCGAEKNNKSECNFAPIFYLYYIDRDMLKRIFIPLKISSANIDEITTNNKEDVSDLIISFSQRSEGLSKLLISSSNVLQTFDSLLVNINSKKGSLGNLIKNDSLYNNLNRTIISLDSLINDFKNHPDKYINVSIF